MSSPTTTSTTTTTAADAAATAAERQTYWCHECDMSVSFLSPSTTTVTTTTSLLCPYCHSDFLEEMDSPLFNPNPNSNPNPILNLSPFTTESTTFQFPSVAPSDDNFLLDSPYLHRLIHHLTTSDSDGSSPSTTTTTTATTTTSRHHSPASKSAVESIPTIKITNTFLSPDPIILCAVCKDQFVIDDETKQLPCKHMYHPDCILPWLSHHNSCPVCRFQLPVEGSGDSKGRRRRSRILRLGELMENDEELIGFGSTLRNIARRHRIVFASGNARREREREREREVSNRGEDESLFSPTQIAEAEMGLAGRSNSVETVSSWPSWPVEGGVGVGAGAGGGEVVDGEISVALNAAWGSDDGDIIMS